MQRCRVRGFGRVRQRLQLPLLKLSCDDRSGIFARRPYRARQTNGDEGCGIVARGGRSRFNLRGALRRVLLTPLLDFPRRVLRRSVWDADRRAYSSSRCTTSLSARRLRGTRSSTTFLSTTRVLPLTTNQQQRFRYPTSTRRPRQAATLTLLGVSFGRLAQGAARSSDLDFVCDETPKLLEMARSPASALPARPIVLHRRASSRRCRNCGRTGSRRPGGRRTPGGVRTLVGRRGHPGCHRPGSRRCFSPPHLGWWAQASVRVVWSVREGPLPGWCRPCCL
jgi:hypothetical protein